MRRNASWLTGHCQREWTTWPAILTVASKPIAQDQRNADRLMATRSGRSPQVWATHLRAAQDRGDVAAQALKTGAAPEL